MYYTLLFINFMLSIIQESFAQLCDERKNRGNLSN